jgi:serine/threonine protein kinase
VSPQKEMPLTDFKTEFKTLNPELVKILNSLIQVNPFYRPTAFELLKNPIFDEYRDKKNEQCPFNKLMVDIDQDEAFDYETQLCLLYKNDEFLEMIHKEAKTFENQKVKYKMAKS